MVNVLAGPNRFVLRRELTRRKSEFIDKNGDLAVETFDGEEAEFEKIMSATQSVSLFTPTKMVIVNELSSNKQAADRIEELITSTPENTELIVVEPKPDKRSSYYKSLKSLGNIEEFKELSEEDLAKWLSSEAGKENAQLSYRDAFYLVHRVGANQVLLSNELRKLIDYSPQINKQKIDELTVEKPQNKVFELLEAAFSGQTKKTLQIYDRLRIGGSQPPVILSMISWQLHLLAIVILSKGKPAQEIADDTGTKLFSIRKSQAIAERLDQQTIKSMISGLAKADVQIKTSRVDSDEVLRSVLTRLTISC